ncbi:hypothetical protein DFJ73DRAFT_849504 [Zopfochytrium polystomum]|nr:hypothetical protein DFJ73DRAFT_849504 [Zopfochytrium polystomum]
MAAQPRWHTPDPHPTKPVDLNVIADSDDLRSDLLDALFGPGYSTRGNSDLPSYRFRPLRDRAGRGFDRGLQIYELLSSWDGAAILRGADGKVAHDLRISKQTFVAAFELADWRSMGSAVEWIKKARVHRGVRLTVLFGMIAKDRGRDVSYADAEAFARTHGAFYCEAVTGDATSTRAAMEVVALAALAITVARPGALVGEHRDSLDILTSAHFRLTVVCSSFFYLPPNVPIGRPC